MAAKWLYSLDGEGVRVTPEFMDRLRNGDKSALRALSTQKLTTLYLKEFTRAPRRNDSDGFFWSDVPDTALIPLVKAGRHSLPAWIKRDVLVATTRTKKNTYYPPKRTEQGHKKWSKFVQAVRKDMKRGEEAVLVKIDGRIFSAWNMMPNPKFDLVVVNRHDRAALLKLLGELDAAPNVEQWLTERTVREGATASKILHADYSAWCERNGQVPVGSKGFAQALVSAGVVKLTRSNAGERYELTIT